MADVNNIDWLAMVLVIVGALNWGLYGLGGFMGSRIDLVAILLGAEGVLAVPALQNIVYLLVGVAGLYLGYFGYRVSQ